MVLAACAFSMAMGCDRSDDSEADTTTTPAALGEAQLIEASPPPQAADLVELRPCELQRGGYGVRVANVSCKEIGRLLSGWGPANVHSGNDPRQGAFVADGWRCWAHLEKEFGPILNVCMRDDQVLVFKVA